jgi:hypothetical protein
MLTWHCDNSGYWAGRNSAGQDVADIYPRRQTEPFRWVAGANTGTAATIELAQKQAEKAYIAQNSSQLPPVPDGN